MMRTAPAGALTVSIAGEHLIAAQKVVSRRQGQHPRELIACGYRAVIALMSFLREIAVTAAGS
jgi:hypothetical protein